MNWLSIVIPTKDEEKNITSLVTSISKAKIPIQYELVVVDDSSDDTAKIANNIGCRVIKGQNRGLGQAIIDGINSSQGNIIVVMDADLSHSPMVIPEMIRLLTHGHDMVIGSRYVKGGKTIGWEWQRRFISRIACLLALPITLKKDATSGFFAFRKKIIQDIKLESSSWKIMLEILLKAKPTRVTETPITFEVRKEGKSKFNRKQMIVYTEHIALLALWKYQRFIKFCIVGGTGALLTFSITWILTELFNFWYMLSLVFAVIIAMTNNFILNSLWTFKVEKSPKEADYEWNAFYKGHLIQKWWKHSIASTILKWTDINIPTIDVGCGSSPIITNYNSNSIGIDTNKNKISFMAERNENVIFSNKEVEKINKQYPQVLCIEVLEHLSNPNQMIKQLARITETGGQVIIATPDYSKKLWKLAEKFTPYKEEHVMQFTKETLERLCIQHNLYPRRHRYIAGCDLVEEFVKIS